MSATFEQLKSGGIRSLVSTTDPNATIANKILAVACNAAQLALDQHLNTPHDLADSTVQTLDAWRAGLALAEAAMAEARDLVQANPGVVSYTTDGLGHTTFRKQFPAPPAKEQSHAKVRR